MKRTWCFWYIVFNANMIIFFHKNLKKFNSKEYTKMKSSHVTTEHLSDKVNCKSTIFLRMIDTYLGFLEKKLNKP